ncbi:hypothetical protein [Nostoc sp.]|uniref:hypothetical protein n=1 Tax=Nostoc sp. TaxID=1180 RepID=UPI002FF6C9C9
MEAIAFLSQAKVQRRKRAIARWRFWRRSLFLTNHRGTENTEEDEERSHAEDFTGDRSF